MKKVFKVLGIIILVLFIIALCVYFFILQYPEIRNNPKIGKWYRVSDKAMKDSEGNSYHALFKKGSDNKVLVYFAGGGVSVNEETARDDTYNTKLVKPDYLTNVTMNMGGIASGVKGSPFENWTIIMFPYATGDFHAGTGEFKYKDKDGKEKILYHNGYNNYTLAMKEIMERTEIDNPDTVLVTGYSAGGFVSSLLADDVFTNYFPSAKSKNVLVDASLLLNDDWHTIATDVWKTPKSISDKLTTNNLTLDCIKSLHEKYGDDINLLFDSSTRDGDLAKVQNYFDTGKMEVDEEQGDVYQQILKDTIPKFKEANVSLFIWDGIAWYDDPRNLTAHTIIATPVIWLPFEEQGKSVAEWIDDVINGNAKDYGIDLINKEYEKTEK
ncbi:pectin acetylesterase-family hydrolase [uncultured Clostridium sp.]|uniref:pectin acetylesterase-family hydrolase n=1 Tax=uncultured Clostridium sp. TaxID=59620 RepID=UPI00272CEA00|nr:pectin acetylesterase-family hydrolase [uncultured Clostridium sp.]